MLLEPRRERGALRSALLAGGGCRGAASSPRGRGSGLFTLSRHWEVHPRTRREPTKRRRNPCNPGAFWGGGDGLWQERRAASCVGVPCVVGGLAPGPGWDGQQAHTGWEGGGETLVYCTHSATLTGRLSGRTTPNTRPAPPQSLPGGGGGVEACPTRAGRHLPPTYTCPCHVPCAMPHAMRPACALRTGNRRRQG